MLEGELGCNKGSRKHHFDYHFDTLCGEILKKVYVLKTRVIDQDIQSSVTHGGIFNGRFNFFFCCSLAAQISVSKVIGIDVDNLGTSFVSILRSYQRGYSDDYSK